jgi:dihydrofolate reductase
VSDAISAPPFPEMPISFVVARARNNVIGCSGNLPWRLGTDLKNFKEITLGKPIVMGRKTWESLRTRPLPNRDNLVLSRNTSYVAEGAFVYSSLALSLSAARAMAVGRGVSEICVVGGQEVFAELQEAVSRIYLTEIDADYVGDAYFPEMNLNSWSQISARRFAAGPRDEADFVMRILER